MREAIKDVLRLVHQLAEDKKISQDAATRMALALCHADNALDRAESAKEKR